MYYVDQVQYIVNILDLHMFHKKIEMANYDVYMSYIIVMEVVEVQVVINDRLFKDHFKNLISNLYYFIILIFLLVVVIFQISHYLLVIYLIQKKQIFSFLVEGPFNNNIHFLSRYQFGLNWVGLYSLLPAGTGGTDVLLLISTGNLTYLI